MRHKSVSFEHEVGTWRERGRDGERGEEMEREGKRWRERGRDGEREGREGDKKGERDQWNRERQREVRKTDTHIENRAWRLRGTASETNMDTGRKRTRKQTTYTPLPSHHKESRKPRDRQTREEIEWTMTAAPQE